MFNEKILKNNIQKEKEFLDIFKLDSNKLIPLALIGINSGSILHDISNPLSLLILGENKSKKELEAYYRTIRSIMHNNEHTEPLNLSEILEDTLKIFEEKSKRYNCKINAIYSKKLFFNGVKKCIYNIFLNLISNACESQKDSLKSNKNIWIILKKYKKHILIEIIDNGCGMTKAVQENIFEPFFSTKENDNSGLGLSLVKYHVTKIHKGEIKVKSGVNIGTKFIIKLPID